MRLVRIGSAIWEVLAIADDEGRSVLDVLLAADPSDHAAEAMLATIKTEVPLNGPPRSKSRCRDLGKDVLEFKTWGVRVLWFFDCGEPKTRRRIICTHYCPKLSNKEFKVEISRAVRLRNAYLLAKLEGTLKVPKPEEESK